MSMVTEIHSEASDVMEVLLLILWLFSFCSSGLSEGLERLSDPNLDLDSSCYPESNERSRRYSGRLPEPSEVSEPIPGLGSP